MIVRKGFLLKILCGGIALLMAIMVCFFPIGSFDVVYAEPCDYLTYFTHGLKDYQIILFFCVCIFVCNLRNKIKWMWMFSVGLMLSYPVIRQIDRMERMTLKLDWKVEVTKMTYTSYSVSELLSLCCILIGVLCFILFLMQRKEEQRLAVLTEEKLKEEREKEENERKDNIIFTDSYLDNFPLNR